MFWCFVRKKSPTISLQDVFIQSRKFFKKFMVNLINPFRPNKSQSWNNHKEIYCLLKPEILTALYKRPTKKNFFWTTLINWSREIYRFPAKSWENKLISARKGKQKKQEKVEKWHYCNKLFNADLKENNFSVFFFSSRQRWTIFQQSSS